jgi:hypothetical protein
VLDRRELVVDLGELAVQTIPVAFERLRSHPSIVPAQR